MLDKLKFWSQTTTETPVPVQARVDNKSQDKVSIGGLRVNNNVLFASVVNMIVNSLDKYDLSPAIPDDPVLSRKAWLSVVVGQLLTQGKVWFVNDNKGYRLGMATPATADGDDWSFTQYSNLIQGSFETERVSSTNVGWIQHVDSVGIPTGLLGAAGASALIIYQSVIEKVGIKIFNEPAAALALMVDYSVSNPDVTRAELDTMEDTVTDISQQKILRVQDNDSSFAQPNFLSVMDKKINETLSSLLIVVLNAVGIPKALFNSHLSHQSVLSSDTLMEFVEFGLKPIASDIVEGLNNQMMRSGKRQRYSWDINVHTLESDLLSTKTAPMSQYLTINEVRERLYGLGPIEGGDEISKTTPANPSSNGDEDEIDREDRTRSAEPANE